MSNLITFALALALGIAVLWLLSDVILVLFAASLLACQLAGAAHFVTRWTKLPYGAALTIVILLIVVALAAFLYWHGPDLVDETTIIYRQVNAQIGSLWKTIGNIDALSGAVDRIKDFAAHAGSHLAGYAAGFVTTTIGGFGTALLIIVAAVYLAAAPALYREGVIALMPHGWRRHGAEVMRQEGRTLRWWFIGQLVDMSAIGVLTFIGLLFLGVKLSVTLALIAALCNFVPYIGALAGSIPAILVALSSGPQSALYVALLFVAVQTLEGNVIAPMIQKRTVELPPVVTLFSQTVLGTLFGPLGLVLATPITAASLVLVKMVYQQKILGDALSHPMKHSD